MIKKNHIIIISIAVLVIVAFVLFFFNTSNTFHRDDSNFAIKDTSTVTKIYLTDKYNNEVLLKKEDEGVWLVNDTYLAINEPVNLLLKTMASLDVRSKVSKSEHDNVVRRMAAIGIKVEIYQTVYRIFLSDNLKWFPYEKLTRVYYVGDATKDNLGTYMLMQGSKHPYICQIRGFNGFLFSRYSTNEDDWRNHSIFHYRLAEIKSLKLEMPDEPEKSWQLNNPDNRNFELISLIDNEVIDDYDTLSVIESLGSFLNVRFEIFLNDAEQSFKDSVINSIPWHILTLNDIYGNETKIKTFHKKANEGEEDYEGNPILWDRDRLYALVNDDKDFVMIQFFIFDKILRPINYFYKDFERKSVQFFEVM